MKRKAAEVEDTSSWDSCSPSSDLSISSTASNFYQYGTIPRPPRFNDHINWRTKKRLRDNRPELDVIHRDTLAKLFGAQQHNQQHDRNETTNNRLSNIQVATVAAEPQQRNLHSFFQIPRSLPCDRPVNMPTGSSKDPDMCCQDCGSDLQSEMARAQDFMDINGMTDILDYDALRCADCNRAVCSTCCVRGDHRICLECALPGG